MLSKQYRLPRKEFKKVCKKGRLFQGKFFSLLAIGQKQPVVRFAFIVSKKIDKKAVARNRIKRLLSEAVYRFLPEIKSGVDGIFLVKKAIGGRNFEEIREEMKEVLIKANLFEQ